MSINKVRGGLYKTARVMGDVQAVKSGRIVPRIKRRILGRIAGKILRRI